MQYHRIVRIVLDTDVIVAALRSPRGASRWLLNKALRRKIIAIISVPLLLEYEAVLNRPEHTAVTKLAEEEISSVLDALASVAKHVRLSFRWRPLLADANDEMVLETAINGNAEFIVTFNLRDFGSAGESFGCRAILPRDMVGTVRGRNKDREQE
jgi:putative PIN family toxin of toxin-antitoxin system